ncbi:MAG: hypothetical protein PHX87_01230 [Candidatus Peribacteraceae bacterium]|nr:hypothetical protein [Candidatus Peribacteraceae bacterium]
MPNPCLFKCAPHRPTKNRHNPTMDDTLLLSDALDSCKKLRAIFFRRQ